MRPDELTRDFFCPLCRSNHFQLITVKSVRSQTPRVVEGLFRCAGCSVIFSDPMAFTRLMQDSIVDEARYRKRSPTREYPPDAETARQSEWKPPGKKG